MTEFNLNLPNFYIIGAAKCGTTSLFANLLQHPEIFMPYKKELHFFDMDENYLRGTEWYINSYFQNAKKYKAIGEATPAYMYWADTVAPRMLDLHGRGTLPKFIAILRDPVERAYSRYWHDIKLGQPLLFEKGKCISFEKAVELEEWIVQSNTKLKNGTAYTFVRGGLYAPQIKIFHKYFPRENFLILLHDDLKQNPDGTFADIFRFIGVDDQFKTNSELRNKAAIPKSRVLYRWINDKSIFKELIKPFFPTQVRYGIKRQLAKSVLTPVTYPPMKPETEIFIRKKFQESIMELEELLGRDLRSWRTGESG